MDKKYDSLLNMYKRMYGMVDAFHFNSQNTRNVFEKYIDVPSDSAVVPITHSSIKDYRRLHDYNHPTLKLGFIGSEATYKGLPVLKRVIERLNSVGLESNISLVVYGGRLGVDEKLSNVVYKGRFSSFQIKNVYESVDLMVVPSICYETFGFTVLEALQFGVPSLVSNTVGAKDIVKEIAPQFVYLMEDDLFEILKRLIGNREELVEYNKRIVESPWKWSIEQHAKEIEYEIYKEKSKRSING